MRELSKLHKMLIFRKTQSDSPKNHWLAVRKIAGWRSGNSPIKSYVASHCRQASSNAFINPRR